MRRKADVDLAAQNLGNSCMATMFILIVLAFYVIRFDVRVVEKLVLTLLIGIAALLPLVWPESRIACAIAQGLIGVFIVLRMHYERAAR
jgi:hypothetical protein